MPYAFPMAVSEFTNLQTSFTSFRHMHTCHLWIIHHMSMHHIDTLPNIQYYPHMSHKYLQNLQKHLDTDTINSTAFLMLWYASLSISIASGHASSLFPVTSPLSLQREDSFITLYLNEIFSILMQNFAFLPWKLMVSHSQGFRVSSLPSTFL